MSGTASSITVRLSNGAVEPAFAARPQCQVEADVSRFHLFYWLLKLHVS